MAAQQLSRPAFRSDLEAISFAFLPCKELAEHCDALCKFGEDHSILRKIARTPAPIDSQPNA